MSLKLNQAAPAYRRNRDDDRNRDEWSDDQPYELLANARRRECVRYLAGRSASDDVSVRELADAIADVLAGDESAPDSLRQSVYTSLSQHHLDKLDGHDVIDYDREERSISTGENFEMVTHVSGVSDSRCWHIGTIPVCTSTLTLATLLVTAVAFPQLPTAAVIGVAALNLLPIGLFVQAHFGDRIL
ncbi:DUF7344 domain-containing protein [Halorussus salinisoli]|uniref:DUF7344 domain-containing protein n=1 Tax=Halorussus salinisoli TaxID=2558242 RepID=UPI0010C22AE3|nr:hypothetical protein [Halorussus salinisoli]